MTPEKKDTLPAACQKVLLPSKAFLNKKFTYSGHTYGDIFQMAAGFKRLLGQNSVPKPVCLCTTNKAVLAASLIASLYSACDIILPYAFSSHALMEVREATGFEIAIADPDHPEDMPGVEMINPDVADISYLHAEDLRDFDNTFLKLFTGGSTGKPRVWPKSPRNLLAETIYLCQKFQLSSRDLFVSTVPPHHIYGLLFSILAPFASRACVMPDVYAFPQEIISTVNRCKATILISIPIHYRSLHLDNLSMPSLKMAFSSAGFLDRSDASHFLKKTSVGIYEIYGSTETGGVAMRNIKEGKESWQPADLLDWRLSGQRLAVRSDFISREIEKDADGFFVTGDEAQPEKDNRFILLGRVDGIVKIAGKRVDLMEIQNKIKGLPTVLDAAVIALPADSGREHILAALVACKLSDMELRKMMMEKLDSYAVPRRIKIVQAIKRSATGKIERRRLEQIFSDEEK